MIDYERMKAMMANPDNQDRLAAVGAALSGLGSGRGSDISGFQESIRKRAAASETKDSVTANISAADLTDEQKRTLLAMPPEAAAQVLAELAFKEPAAPTQGVFDPISGALINPVTGATIREGAEKAPETTTLEQNARAYALTQGAPGTPEYQAAYAKVLAPTGPASTNVNVTTGDGTRLPPNVVDIDYSKGLMTLLDEGGRPYQEAIPGGIADTEREGTESEKAAEAAAAAERQQAVLDGKDTTTNVITNATDVLYNLDQERVQSSGVGASLAGFIPGSKNSDMNNHVATLAGMASFETLNAMRQQSPTGGALGGVSEGELKLLSASAGALDPTSPDFARDLANYERALLRTIHGPETGELLADQAQARRLAGDTTIEPANAPAPTATPQRRVWNPATGGFD